MKKEDLKELGLSEEQIKGVMAKYGESVNPLQEQVTTLTKDRDGLQSQLDTVNGQLVTLQKENKGNADLETQIKDLQAANEQANEAHQQELATTKRDYLTDLALTQAGAKNVKAVKALLDIDSLKLDKDGQLLGLDEQLKSVKSENDFLFNQQEPIKPDTPKISVTGNPNPSVENVEDLTSKIQARLLHSEGE